MESTTRVVNVRVKYLRPHYNDLQEWCADPKNIYIGRKGIVFVPDGRGGKTRFPKENSPWCNPYKDGPREEILIKYRAHILRKINNKEVNLEELRGKNLGCWCAGENKCHGEILLELLEKV